MEGPFLAEAKRGSQNSRYLRNPDIDEFDRLQKEANGMIKIVTVAPELPGAMDFARDISRKCIVSAGHTEAAYEQASRFFDAGASHVTHLYNAMTEMSHRAPGLIGAASERAGVTAELICDGIHVHPSAVRIAFRMFPERICLISDALRCAGMPDGEYELAGKKVTLEKNVARLPDGTIAGSASDLFSCMRNAIKFGVSEKEAIKAATINPAKVIGIDGKRGSIDPGKIADFVICDKDWNIKGVCLRGTVRD